MSISDIVMKTPCWYHLILIIFSIYYAIRGVLYMKKYGDTTMSRTEKVIIDYIQEILFKVVFTASGFIALLIANDIFLSLKSFDNVAVGTTILLIFLVIWGICGVSGYLTYLIISGKFLGTLKSSS